MHWQLHFDMRAPDFGAPAVELYREALAMSAWADEHDAHQVVVCEHHGEDDGYLPSPLVMAAAIAARTERVRIAVKALVLTLHDPIRAAEAALVADLVAGGRLEITVVAGYVQSEFDMFGVDYGDRPGLFERNLELFTQALTGQPFEHLGRTIQVTPGPVQEPRMTVLVGGAGKAGARRAARFGDGFAPTGTDDALRDTYLDECARLGREPGPVYLPKQPMGVHVTDDPERAWAVYGPHALHELNSYGKWASQHENHPYAAMTDVAIAQQAGFFAVVTPDECIELARSLPETSNLSFKPLIGGLDPVEGWSSLELFVDKVLPVLQADGTIAAS